MAVLSVKERQELLAQSTYGNGGKGKGRSRGTGFRGVTGASELPSKDGTGSVSLKALRTVIGQTPAKVPSNPHRKEIQRLENNPDLIQKDREHYEQTMFFAEVYEKYPQFYNLLAATPNGGFRKKAERWRLCAEGQKAGWPDTQFMLPRHGFYGLFIEFKKPFECYRCMSEARRAPKPHQINTLRMLVGQGYAGFIAYGAREAMKIFEAYIAQRPVMEDLILFFPNEKLKEPIEGEFEVIDSFAIIEAEIA
ncbi:TPA: hypothetical protein ACGSTL_001279 [Vibrio parahaemolyticus]|uniref:hypothetical protein n=1 Tax=Vibrio campbellii TaxID=680 RepID=UPI001F07158A|nr:hypothetical protein [Vibrio campbellii]UMM06697.1 hypothetical protein MKR81_27500 [Vibrio campbellii]